MCSLLDTLRQVLVTHMCSLLDTLQQVLVIQYVQFTRHIATSSCATHVQFTRHIATSSCDTHRQFTRHIATSVYIHINQHTSVGSTVYSIYQLPYTEHSNAYSSNNTPIHKHKQLITFLMLSKRHVEVYEHQLSRLTLNWLCKCFMKSKHNFIYKVLYIYSISSPYVGTPVMCISTWM